MGRKGERLTSAQSPVSIGWDWSTDVGFLFLGNYTLGARAATDLSDYSLSTWENGEESSAEFEAILGVEKARRMSAASVERLQSDVTRRAFSIFSGATYFQFWGEWFSSTMCLEEVGVSCWTRGYLWNTNRIGWGLTGIVIVAVLGLTWYAGAWIERLVLIRGGRRMGGGGAESNLRFFAFVIKFGIPLGLGGSKIIEATADPETNPASQRTNRVEQGQRAKIIIPGYAPWCNLSGRTFGLSFMWSVGKREVLRIKRIR